MREAIRDKERLQHILSAIQVLLANKDRHTLEEIADDPIIFYGYVKHVEIIGEAVYKLTKEFRERHTEVNWGDQLFSSTSFSKSLLKLFSSFLLQNRERILFLV